MGAPEVVIVGGGAGGLATAVGLARQGLRVVVLEAGPRWGGRAASDTHGAFVLNQGPHALYAPSRRALRSLGVEVESHPVPHQGACLDDGERLHPLPASPFGLASSTLISGAHKARFALAFSRAMLGSTSDATPLGAWLESIGDGPARTTLATLLRLATYGAPSACAVGPLLGQLRSAILHPVEYVDGGWQTLVDALRARAEALGATLHLRTGVDAVTRTETGFTVEAHGSRFETRHVVLCISSRAAAELTARPMEDDGILPLRAACLDLALTGRPVGPWVSLGTREPTYVSVHSDVARLGPAGSASIHAALYLGDAQPHPHADRARIEAALDRSHPGWRPLVAHARFLPLGLAGHGSRGPLTSRPPVLIEAHGAATLQRVGDWVGPEGMLLDAVLASSAAAVRTIMQAPRPAG